MRRSLAVLMLAVALVGGCSSQPAAQSSVTPAATAPATPVLTPAPSPSPALTPAPSPTPTLSPANTLTAAPSPAAISVALDAPTAATRILSRLDELATLAAGGDGDATGQWALDEGNWVNANMESLASDGMVTYVLPVLALLSAVGDGSDQTASVNALLAMRGEIAAAGGLSTPKPTPKPKPIAYATLSSRSWAMLVKVPDNYVGKAYHLYGCISQFDAATGTDMFRAQASYQDESYWYTDGVNAFFSGDTDKLAPYVEGDVVSMNVLSMGSYSYDTQNGGNTTVPEFQVVTIKRMNESC